jgi:Carboxypeptidase regulatory-like domain
MIRKTLVGLLVISVALVFGSSAFAKKYKYEEGTVSGGGSISGSVSLKGNPAPPIMEDLNKGKNVEFCATHPDTQKGGIRPRTKVVAKGGKLSGTVVFIENLAKGKAWGWKNQNFDFTTCDIFPKVAVIKKASKAEKKAGGVATITNNDPDVLHNPHGYSVVGASRKTLFNKPLPSKGDVAEVSKNLARFKKKKDKHFFLQCDQHNFMEADARIVWNPYFAVTGADGSFKITDIPAGKYKVTAWHPYVGEVTSEVTVGGGADAKQDFTLTAK